MRPWRGVRSSPGRAAEGPGQRVSPRVSEGAFVVKRCCVRPLFRETRQRSRALYACSPSPSVGSSADFPGCSAIQQTPLLSPRKLLDAVRRHPENNRMLKTVFLQQTAEISSCERVCVCVCVCVLPPEYQRRWQKPGKLSGRSVSGAQTDLCELC